LVTFFALTFGWTWGLWAATVLLPDTAARIKTLLLLASALGPSLSGFAVVLLFDGPTRAAHLAEAVPGLAAGLGLVCDRRPCTDGDHGLGPCP